MTDVFVRADEALIVCNQMLNVFLLARQNHILHEFLLVTNAMVVLYVQRCSEWLPANITVHLSSWPFDHLRKMAVTNILRYEAQLVAMVCMSCSYWMGTSFTICSTKKLLLAGVKYR